ncbi:hypothetical protein VSH64_25785 [Amycolatopsis rhabdoformis]|uniref:Profilin n=1 Tax=Amycolatopsis rhabdoformis TaxID=1448059 RepID=A0ABZ1HWR0_9PSEU|nr:hypothetical protein [Amycolatopsis rhabdoformis]WSE26289.1 hypothetical protein VSH64_25785 [Amycolatopsis rhabdoformis]
MDTAEYKRAFLDNHELVTSEEPPDEDGGLTFYSCDYIMTSSHQTSSGTLTVLASPGETSVKTSLKQSAEACSDKPKYLSDNAFYCSVTQGYVTNTFLVVTTISRGQLRVAMVTAGPPPDLAHPDGYATLAKILADRL